MRISLLIFYIEGTCPCLEEKGSIVINFRIIFIATLLLITYYETKAYADYDSGRVAYDNHDYATAFKELAPLAKKGDARAQNILGQMYRHGNGVEADVVIGTTWIHKAATKGWAPAQYDLGVIFRNLAVTKSQYKKAVKWLTEASLQGHLQAQFALGKMYRDGFGVVNDDVKALVLFNKAAKKIKEVRAARKQLMKRMSQKDINRAKGMGLAVLKDNAKIKTFAESKTMSRNVKGECGEAGKSLHQLSGMMEKNAALLKECIGLNWNGSLCSGQLYALKETYEQLTKAANILKEEC